MEDPIFEFVAIYGVLCMCFLKVVQKQCKINYFEHVVLPKCPK